MHAQLTLINYSMSRLALSDPVEVQVDPPAAAQAPRWSKVHQAREQIHSGIYEHPVLFAKRLDSCLNSLARDIGVRLA